MSLYVEDQRSAVTIALQRMTEERRRYEQDIRNAQRLRRWRVRWWREFGWWPRTPRVASNVIPMERRRRQDRTAAMAHPG